MNSRARLAHVVELEGVGHDAVGQRRLRRLRLPVHAQNSGPAAQTGVANESADGTAPRLRRSVERDRQSIEDARLRALDHFLGDVPVVQLDGEAREALRGVHGKI